jgi:hypothetical protein
MNTISNVFTVQDETRMQEIVKQFAVGNVSEDLFGELRSLNQKKETFKIEREGKVSEVKQAIVTLSMTFAEVMATNDNGVQHFSKDTFLAFAKAQGWLNQVIASLDKKPTKQAKTKDGLLLFEVQPPKAKGPSTKIYKGDAFPLNGIGAKLVWLVQQEGNLKDNLMNHCSDSAETLEYLGTDEGKAEIAKWIDYIAMNAPSAGGVTEEEAQEATETATEEVETVVETEEVAEEVQATEDEVVEEVNEEETTEEVPAKKTNKSKRRR